MNISTLPPLDPTNPDSLVPEPGKRQWEVGKAGYLSWARAQLVQGGPLQGSASADEVNVAPSKDDVAAALHTLEPYD